MRLRVIGAYLPRLDQSAISEFIAKDVAQFRERMRDLVRRGIANRSDQEIDARADELPEELDADLQTCALFEVEVRDNDQDFDPANFEEPSQGYCGWEPAFLTLDGGEVAFEGWKAPPERRDFRVAFYIHQWPEGGRLHGPTGELELPPFQPVPARLWRLAPYACVD